MDPLKEITLAPGAEFLISPGVVAEKLRGIRAFIFDWDGVFNDGVKQANGSSSFNEIDSMGVNLLRFASWLKNKKQVFTAIISGEKNETAFFFAQREHFHASYSKMKDKRIALQHFCESNEVHPSEICFFFDDVLDLPIASEAGLRILVPRPATLQFTNFVKENRLADYITGSPSGQYSVREACEMLIHAGGLYKQVITSRVNFDDVYKQYIASRQDITTQFYNLSNGAVSKAE